LWGLVSSLVLVGVIVPLFTQFKGDYNDNFNLPDSESTRTRHPQDTRYFRRAAKRRG
jgi:hypothetical protein